MRITITLSTAERLFPEAYAFDMGFVPYLSTTSEIRMLAHQMYGKANLPQISAIISEIYQVLASAYMAEHGPNK